MPAAPGRERLHHDLEREPDRFGEEGLLLGISAVRPRHDGIGEMHSQGLLTM